MIAVLGIVAALATAHLPAGTDDAAAQQAFDRGLFFYYAFDREDALAQFASLPAALPMAQWGQALALGPDLNTPMTPERYAAAAAAIARVPADTALLQAMALRYRGTWDEWEGNNARYRRAMVQLARASPGSVNLDTLAAEAVLEHSPMVWQNGKPATDDTRTALALIDDALAAAPTDAMANHLCIHAYDEAEDRTPAIACAQRLDAATLPPQAEHLAHMPAHTWIETGAYAKAVSSSERAYGLLQALAALHGRPATDERYAGHDTIVGYTAAMMLGNYALAQTWSRRMDAFPSSAGRYGGLTALRFGRYADAANAATANAYVGMPVRGLALLHEGRTEEASALAQRMHAEMGGDPRRGYLPQLFLARLAEARGDDARARSWYAAASDNQHAAYGAELIPEIPAEEALGGYLLRRGAYRDAADAFRACLKAYPEDPRALYGLAAALAALGDADGARDARERFDAAWAVSDTAPSAADL